MTITAKIDVGKLTALFGNIEADIMAAISEGMDEVAEFAQKHASETSLFKNNGINGLRNSIKIESNGAFVRTVIADKDYAPYVEYGRGEVRPVNAKALRFVVNGELIFTKRSAPVAAKPFMAQAKAAAENEAPRIFDRIISKINK